MGTAMPDYGDILKFLAENPPTLATERQLHASLLELLASCLRAEENEAAAAMAAEYGDKTRAMQHAYSVAS